MQAPYERTKDIPPGNAGRVSSTFGDGFGPTQGLVCDWSRLVMVWFVIGPATVSLLFCRARTEYVGIFFFTFRFRQRRLRVGSNDFRPVYQKHISTQHSTMISYSTKRKTAHVLHEYTPATVICLPPVAEAKQ